jgi:hypothetical protein
MKFLKRTLAVTALALASTSAMADWNLGTSYSHLSNGDPSLAAVTVNAGYTFDDNHSNWSVMPELRVGTGVKNYRGFEIDRYMVVATRVDYQANDVASFFVQPAYANIKSDGHNEWEFGMGVGSSFQLSNDWELEVMYENFDSTDVVTLGARFNF